MGHNRVVTFSIPFTRDKQAEEALQARLIKSHGLENSDAQVVFVVDYARAAIAGLAPG
jgi:hypothetical protein